MADNRRLLDHLHPKSAIPWNDLTTFDLYERNFGVILPADFLEVMSSYNSAIVSAIYAHPDLPIDGNEFYLWRFASIGRHNFNDGDDLLVRTEFEYYNNRSIPRKVLVFAFDYQDWPIYLDLTDGGDGRIAVHSDDDRLQRPAWANLDHAYPCSFVADGFSHYVRNLTPDPDPPV